MGGILPAEVLRGAGALERTGLLQLQECWTPLADQVMVSLQVEGTAPQILLIAGHLRQKRESEEGSQGEGVLPGMVYSVELIFSLW